MPRCEGHTVLIIAAREESVPSCKPVPFEARIAPEPVCQTFPFDKRSKTGLYKLRITGVRELRGCLVQRGYELGLYTASELPKTEGPGKDRNLPQCQTRDTKNDGLCKVFAKVQHGCKSD